MTIVWSREGRCEAVDRFRKMQGRSPVPFGGSSVAHVHASESTNKRTNERTDWLSSHSLPEQNLRGRRYMHHKASEDKSLGCSNHLCASAPSPGEEGEERSQIVKRKWVDVKFMHGESASAVVVSSDETVA